MVCMFLRLHWPVHARVCVTPAHSNKLLVPSPPASLLLHYNKDSYYVEGVSF